MNAKYRHLIKLARKKSIYHHDDLKNSNLCGCFHCLAEFEYKDVVEWVDDNDTALCPNCAIDSVIGDHSGIPITREFLRAMKRRWF
ncbi:cytoplasmic protein [Shewanella sp. Isolate11]|uniref:cytoplasmic protein n=1 Tax=Shewanella sp. Isolate11 TaxID=2908530 RepID=UPI001EFD0501|nr:cytoplasmic protein [Shewanella sp. Isolate11]MCG9697060.1 cytoplasmic protein [Shewanella sp. Isolate11]